MLTASGSGRRRTNTPSSSVDNSILKVIVTALSPYPLAVARWAVGRLKGPGPSKVIMLFTGSSSHYSSRNGPPIGPATSCQEHVKAAGVWQAWIQRSLGLTTRRGLDLDQRVLIAKLLELSAGARAPFVPSEITARGSSTTSWRKSTRTDFVGGGVPARHPTPGCSPRHCQQVWCRPTDCW